MEKVISYWL